MFPEKISSGGSPKGTWIKEKNSKNVDISIWAYLRNDEQNAPKISQSFFGANFHAEFFNNCYNLRAATDG